MKKVFLLKGLPGSGKSTWAEYQMRAVPNTKRINKDSLRAMLDCGKWTKANEKFVLATRDALILSALDEGCHVIVDDTNLVDKHEIHIRELVKGKAEVVIKDFRDVPLEVCIERDLKRPNSVGETVIRRMYKDHIRPKVEAPAFVEGVPWAIICDIDGTLALSGWRDPYDGSLANQDPVNEAVATLVRLPPGDEDKIILVSGRDEKYREITEDWLKTNRIPFAFLYMRPANDSRQDVIVKQEIYREKIEGKYNVRFVLDDRNQTVQGWRDLGLTCLQVADGSF